MKKVAVKKAVKKAVKNVAAKQVTATVPVVPAVPLYTATIKVLGKVYTATGATVPESITALQVGVARGVSILTIKRGDVLKERIIGIRQTNNLFNTRGMVHSIHLKQVSSLFAGI